MRLFCAGGCFVKMPTRFGMSVNNDAVAWKLRVWICFKLKTSTLPMPSMYGGIFTHIYFENQPDVGKYAIHGW